MTSLVRLDTDRPRQRIRSAPALRLVPDAPDLIEPHLDVLVREVAQRVLEVESGRRPLRQLAHVLSPAVYNRIAHRHRRLSRRARILGQPLLGPTPRAARTIVGQRNAEGRYEATVLVTRGPRTTAVAVSAERYEGSWRITEFCPPEDVARERVE